MTSLDPTRPSLSLPLDAVLAYRAADAGDQPAVIYARGSLAGESWRWRDLDVLTSRAASGLRSRGVERGDRVGVILHDSPNCLATVFGVWRTGAALVPLDRRWGPQTFATVVEHADVACIAGPPGDQPNRALTRRPFVTDDELTTAPCDGAQPASSAIDDIAIITFTSGTTGNPKGIVLRHRHLRQAYSIARNHLFDTPPARFGSVFKMGGLGVLGLNFLFAMECGSSTVVLPELTLESAAGFWADVNRASVDFVYLVPSLVQLVTRLSRPLKRPEQVDCITGAAPISSELHREFQDRFGHPLRNIYGISEATFGVFYGAFERPGRGAWHLGPVASPIQARLRAPDGTVVGAEGEGELEITGPVLADGYWRNPSATGETFVDGWLRTGDLARRDRDNNYTIVGRLKDVVIRGGFNIHLDEVDQTLAAHPAVLGACAVGLTREGWEEEIVAVVQIDPGAGVRPADISEWCRGKLGPSKTPGTVYLVDDPLPRNGSGKIVRYEVRQLVHALRS